MEWRKSPDDLIRTFDLAVPTHPHVERRPMFGFPAAFVGGNMFGGTFEEKIVLRLPAARRIVFLSQRDAKPFEPMPGKPMEDYVVAPPALIADRDTLKRWLHEAMTYAASLPATSKGAKSPSKKAAAPASAARTTTARKPLAKKPAPKKPAPKKPAPKKPAPKKKPVPKKKRR